METTRYYPNINQAVKLLVLYFLLSVIVTLIFKIVGSSLSPIARMGTIGLVISVAILFLGIKMTQGSFEEICPLSSFQVIILLPLTLLTIGLNIILSEAGNILITILPMPPRMVEFYKEISEGGIVSLIFLIIMGPLTEELLFRGLILRGFLSHYTIRKSVFSSAVIFTVFHLNLYQFFAAFCIGVFLAWLFLKTRSLLPCIFVHSLNNGQVWIAKHVLRLDIPGYTSDISANVQFHPLWFDLLGCFLLGVGLILLARVIRQGDSNNTSHNTV